MTVELFPVLAAGVAGALAMFAVQLAASATGPAGTLDVVGLWSFVLGLPARSARAAGLLVHVLVSIGVAAGYALGFRVGEVTDVGWAWGLIGGVIHWVASGTVLGVFPAGDVVARSPGPFARRLGPPGALGFLVAHLVFGLVVGIVYFTLHSSGGAGAAF